MTLNSMRCESSSFKNRATKISSRGYWSSKKSRFAHPASFNDDKSLFGIVEGTKVWFYDSPVGYARALLPFPAGSTLNQDPPVACDVQVGFTTGAFASQKTEIIYKLQTMNQRRNAWGSIWVCIGGGAATAHSGQATVDFVRFAALELGLLPSGEVRLNRDWVAVCAHQTGGRSVPMPFKIEPPIVPS